MTLTVAPPAANLFVNDNLQLTATLTDAGGDPVSSEFTWSSDNPSVASVDANGLVHGLSAGEVTIRVAARGEEAAATLTVVVDNGQLLTVSPTSADLFVDNTERFRATLTNRHGDTIPATPEWSSNNAGVATVDATGLVHAAGVGSATIQAKANGLTASAAVTVTVATGGSVLVGAGDIASAAQQAAATATATLLDGIQGTVVALGDNAYEDGSDSDYANYYAPTWGRHKARTRPVPGNHEYFTPNATGYFNYFGSAAGERGKGYYSYNLGSWHIIALNSSLPAQAGSPQEQWLRADLAGSQARCTLAYWHHPRFSSGTTHGGSLLVTDLWQALYEYGAEIVLSAHEHNYERFAPQTATGASDPSKGIREFVVGTGGGESLYPFGAPKPNSEVRHNGSRGVLKLTLYGNRYEWRFIPTSGSFTDTGSGSCH